MPSDLFLGGLTGQALGRGGMAIVYLAQDPKTAGFAVMPVGSASEHTTTTTQRPPSGCPLPKLPIIPRRPHLFLPLYPNRNVQRRSAPLKANHGFIHSDQRKAERQHL